MELDNIGDAGDAQFIGAQADGSDDADWASRFLDATVRLLVKKSALGRESVVFPLLLDVKESKPPGAMDVLPHGGQGKQLLFRVQSTSFLLCV